MPNGLTVGSPLRTKLPNPNPMIVAAAAITRPLVSSPETTERLGSSPASACSLSWMTKNISKSIQSPKPLAHAGRPSPQPAPTTTQTSVIALHPSSGTTPAAARDAKATIRSVSRVFRVAPSVAFRVVGVPREGP
jgi:hypothetical protein